MQESKEIKLNRWQSMVWHDTSRYIVLACGRRAGKSTLSALKIATFVQSHPNSIVYYVAPTYQQSKSIMWEMLKTFIPAHWKVKETEDQLKIELKNGSRIELKGADTEPDRLRGVRIDYLICDEVAFFKSWKTVWEKVLRPTLTDSKGSALFISTPLGYNHFFDMYMRGTKRHNSPDKNRSNAGYINADEYEARKYDKEWSSYKFTTYDNEYIDPLEIDKARAEMDEDTFAQEYLSEFKRYTGLVLKHFSREKHYIAPVEFKHNWTYYRGIDFGWTNPSAVCFLAVTDKGVVYVYDLIYQAGLTASELASLIKQKSVGIHFTGTWADSAQQADIEQLRKFGLVVNAVSKSVTKGAMKGEDFTSFKVRKMNELIKQDKLYVFNTLPLALYEIENWQYKEVKEGTTIKEKPAKVNDHFIDALSYAVINLPMYFEPSLVESENTRMERPSWFDRIPSWTGIRRAG